MATTTPLDQIGIVPSRALPIACAWLAMIMVMVLAAVAQAASVPPDILAAVRSGDVEKVQAALQAGADVNARDGWGRTPLLVATQLKNTAAVRVLLEKKADVDAANQNDITPLIAAVQTGNREAARLLLEAGAAPDRADNLGWTALKWATHRKDEVLAKMLLDHGADAAKAQAAAPAPAPSNGSSRVRVAPAFDAGRVVRGNPQAPITIFEYTDFQCPYCRHGANVVEEVMARYEGQVRLVVKHLPLPQLHPMALPSARYFEAIALQGGDKAWAFYDRVFREQEALAGGEAYLRKVAAELGVDMARLDRDLLTELVRGRIDADLAESRQYGFDGVPAFVVDGEVIKGAQPAARFFAAIEAAQRR